MRSSVILGLAAFVCVAAACSSEDDGAPQQSGNDAAVLPQCPDETDLQAAALPCDCYGNEANATTIADPTCKTQVVCCPTIGNLRCEDYEYCDDAGTCWDAANIPEAAAPTPKCKIEVDLSTGTLPCDCFGTLVTDPQAQMPDCTLKVLCCPATSGLKCE